MNINLNERVIANNQDLLNLDKKIAEVTRNLQNYTINLEHIISEKIWQYIKMLEEINNAKNNIYCNEREQAFQLIKQLNTELEKKTGINLTTSKTEEGLPLSGVFKV